MAVKGPSIVDDIPWGVLLEIGLLMIIGDADVVQVGGHVARTCSVAPAGETTRIC